jgi:hypothetical protein
MGKTIGFRLPDQDKALVEEICRARGEDVSDLARRAIRKELASLGYYSEYRKALGLAQE